MLTGAHSLDSVLIQSYSPRPHALSVLIQSYSPRPLALSVLIQSYTPCPLTLSVLIQSYSPFPLALRFISVCYSSIRTILYLAGSSQVCHRSALFPVPRSMYQVPPSLCKSL
jgi:hypothetical protein